MDLKYHYMILDGAADKFLRCGGSGERYLRQRRGVEVQVRVGDGQRRAGRVEMGTEIHPRPA